MTAADQSGTAGLQEGLDELAASGQEALADRLASFFAAIAAEAARHKAFGRTLESALAIAGSPSQDKRASSRPHRRSPAAVNPFELYERGEDELRRGLALLDLEQLKDVIAEHGMDRDKLAMKWKTPDRLIGRIVETVKARAQKGDVFRR